MRAHGAIIPPCVTPDSPSPPPRSPRRLEAALLLLAALVFAWACLDWRGPGPPERQVASPPPWLLALDDAYIFIRYAQQAARGLPLQWNTGEPSTGASSVLFTLPLIPVHWLSDNPAVWSQWSRIVGILSLWLLGLAAAAALRAASAPEPWPLAGGLAVVWSGPVGFGAVAGMESAANAALILLTCAAWSRALQRNSLSPWGEGRGEGHGINRTPLVLASLLPLMRPENGILTLLAVAAALLLRDRRRWTSLLALLPGALYALINLLATGEAAPAGALSKSWPEAAFATPAMVAEQSFLTFTRILIPVYLGRLPTLWFPVGLLAIATSLVTLIRHRRSPITPLAVAWAVLFLTAPLSAYLSWQQMRHHHAGLACAWVLAVAGLARAAEALASRWTGRGLTPRRRALSLFLPLPLVLAFPYWGREHDAAAGDLFQRHARAINWLAQNGRGATLLLNDAGLIALAHDGPMIDLMGLGTPDLTLAYRHGPGAIVETLARHHPLPALAAVNLDLLHVPQLLGRPLVLAPTPGATVVAEVRRDLLTATALEGPGVDFSSLPDEEKAGIRWLHPPDPRQPSFALLLPDGAEPIRLEGCRPMHESVGLDVPPGTRQVRLRAALLLEGSGALVAQTGGQDGPQGPSLGRSDLLRTAWSRTDLPWPQGGARLWLTRQGSALPCLESVRFLSN